MSIIKFLRDLSKSDSPLKTLGLTTLAIAGYFGVKAACESICNYVKSRIKIKEAKDIAAIEAEKYARKKEADAKFLEQKAGIDVERKRQIQALRGQDETVNDAEVVEASGCPTHSTQEIFNHSQNDSLRWVVDGYALVGQITLLVSGSGKGKSQILTSIAIATAKGERLEFLPDDCCPATKQDVVYYRMETFSGEFKGKYGGGAIFNGTGIQWVQPEDLNTNDLNGLFDHVKQMAASLKHDTLLIIDPATKLNGYTHGRCIKGLEEAQRIASENGVTLTVLVAAHLEEIEDWKPLTSTNIKGGDTGIQQAGAVIAFRRERTEGGSHRFIQCLKAPKGQCTPHPEGVIVCKGVKETLDENNWYVHYEYVGIRPEVDALPVKPKASKSTSNEKPKLRGNQKVTDEQRAEIIRLHDEEGLTYEELAKMFGVSVRTIRRILESHRDNKRHDNNKSK